MVQVTLTLIYQIFLNLVNFIAHFCNKNIIIQKHQLHQKNCISYQLQSKKTCPRSLAQNIKSRQITNILQSNRNFLLTTLNFLRTINTMFLKQQVYYYPNSELSKGIFMPVYRNVHLNSDAQTRNVLFVFFLQQAIFPQINSK